MNSPSTLSIDTSTSTMARPTREQLLARARAMVPALKERAAECENLRRAPAQTIEDFRQAGFFKIGQPQKYGGYEMDYDVLCEVIMEVARGCAASGWNLAVLGEHQATIGDSSEQALEEIWGQNPDALLASGNDPKAELVPVDGGYRFTGRLRFSSGCDHASWWLTGAPVAGSGSRARRRVLLSGRDAKIIDNWHVAGMSGSGSKDVEFNDVFVPAYRVLDPSISRNPHPNYRLPQLSTKPFTLVAVCLGAAGGMIEQYAEWMTSRISRDGDTLSDFQSVQMRIGESAAEFDAARRVLVADVREALACLRIQDKLPLDMHIRNRRDLAYCSCLAIRISERISYGAGAYGWFASNDLQRKFRDIHAGSMQLRLHWDSNMAAYGRFRLGLPIGGPEYV